jgi:hypothetical protein
MHPTTIDDVPQISRHYMLNGERPYRVGAPEVKDDRSKESSILGRLRGSLET